jgi:hypothetical protein
MTKNTLKHLIRKCIKESLNENKPDKDFSVEVSKLLTDHLDSVVKKNSLDKASFDKVMVPLVKELVGKLTAGFKGAYNADVYADGKSGAVIKEVSGNEVDITKLTDIEVEGVNPKDRPDFVDSYVSAARVRGVALTDEQLDWVNANHPEIEQEEAQQHGLDRYSDMER